MKRATFFAIDRERRSYISIHALVKRATCNLRYARKSSKYFNPRPREEGDSATVLSTISKLIISIHALVKRATKVFAKAKYQPLISIHALVKRATAMRIYFLPRVFDFNPRPREEGDGKSL